MLDCFLIGCLLRHYDLVVIPFWCFSADAEAGWHVLLDALIAGRRGPRARDDGRGRGPPPLRPQSFDADEGELRGGAARAGSHPVRAAPPVVP